MCVCVCVCTYISFFRSSSLLDCYYSISSIVPCALQLILIICLTYGSVYPKVLSLRGHRCVRQGLHGCFLSPIPMPREWALGSNRVGVLSAEMPPSLGVCPSPTCLCKQPVFTWLYFSLQYRVPCDILSSSLLIAHHLLSHRDVVLCTAGMRTGMQFCTWLPPIAHGFLRDLFLLCGGRVSGTQQVVHENVFWLLISTSGLALHPQAQWMEGF